MEPELAFVTLSETFSTQERLLLGLIQGLISEVVVAGLIQSFYFEYSLFHRRASVKLPKPPKKKKQSTFLPSIPVLFFFCNVFLLLYTIATYKSHQFTQSNCRGIQLFQNLACHFAHILFDVFLLYKSYILSNSNTWVERSCLIIFLHRIAWSGLDLFETHGYWRNGQCVVFQSSLSGMGCILSDILADAFCTVVSVTCSWKYIGSGVTKIGEVVLHDNVARSVVILSTNMFCFYVALTVADDPFKLWLAYLAQAYVYARCLNAEAFWVGIRRRSMNTTIGKNTTAQCCEAERR
ncbi:hypothetical protein BCR33DRAFT_765557, partial [Rhizoclosmatium globosum]